MPKKIIHYWGKMDDKGNVSALCYKNPHAIDLSKAS